MTGMLEKRKNNRLKLRGYIADIADGHFVYDGIIDDVSVDGLRLNDLPERFIMEKRKYNLVLSGGPDSVCFKLTVYPRWIKKNQYSLDIGFHITGASTGWKTFIQAMMPADEEQDGIWDNRLNESNIE